MPRPPTPHEIAKAWEKKGHLLHRHTFNGAWECWTHDACDAVTDGKLQDLPA